MENGSTTISSFMPIKSCSMLGEVEVGKVMWCLVLMEMQGQLQVVQMLALVAAGLLVTVGHNVTSMVPRLFLFYV